MQMSLELIGTGVAAVLAGIGELWRRGKFRFRRRRNDLSNGDRDKLDSIHETIIHVDEKVENIEEKTDRNAYLIRQFHAGESIDVSVERILDEDEDFYRGAGDSPHGDD